MTNLQQRALLVDDHALVRSGIRRMIEGITEETQVVGETDSGRDALRMIEDFQVDLLITDLSMPDLDGIGLIRAAKKRRPNLRCIVLSMHTDREYVAAAIRAGACGYLHKNAAADDLLQALEAARNGGHYLHPTIAGSVVDLLREAETAADPIEQLSDRQREVLKLLAEGQTTREIAATLSLSVKTIETHRSQLMGRLGIKTIPGLVRFAIRHGLVDL